VENPWLAQVEPALIATTSPSPLLAPSLWRRMACWTYEGMLLFGVLFAGGYLFSLFTQTRHALDNRHPQQAFLFLLLGLYFIWSWRNGQTLAMKTWRIGVRDQLGRSLSPARAAARYLLCWIWFLPPVLVAWLTQLRPVGTLGLLCAWVLAWALASRLHPERQFLHDAWAGTRLVDVSPAA
jgi:uncharacterized RDD family membrane protein YckC